MKLNITGQSPLIMHNGAASDPMHPLAKQLKAITSKRPKTDEDHFEISRISWIAGLYLDSNGTIVLPGPNIFRALLNSARRVKKGPAVQGGVFVLGDAPLEYPGPRDLDALWGNGDSIYVDRRPVVLKGNRVPGVRPIFPTWAASFDVEIDESIINFDDFVEIAERAGRVIGVGDFRPEKSGPYGRFTAEVVK